MQGVWYTDPCKHKISFVRFCAVLHVSPALHRTSAGAFACPYPKSVLCCKGRQRMERNLLVFILTFWRRGRPLQLETAGGVWRFLRESCTGGFTKGAGLHIMKMQGIALHFQKEGGLFDGDKEYYKECRDSFKTACTEFCTSIGKCRGKEQQKCRCG